MRRLRAWLRQLPLTDRVVVALALLLVVLVALSRGDEPTEGIEPRSLEGAERTLEPVG